MKMTPRKVRLWTLIAMVTGFLVCVLGFFLDGNLVIGIGVLIMMGAVVFNFVFCRCPYCGKSLDRYVGNYCPRCGEKLDE